MSLMEGSKLIFAKSFVRSFHNMDFAHSSYSSIKLSVMVDLVCVYSFLYIFPHLGLNMGGERRGGGSGGKQCREGIQRGG